MEDINKVLAEIDELNEKLRENDKNLEELERNRAYHLKLGKGSVTNANGKIKQ